MRFIVLFVAVNLFGCNSIMRRTPPRVTTQTASPTREVFIPGVNTPVSGPGTAAQVPVNQAPALQPGEKDPKILPPSDPRSFGIAIPLGKTKKDTLK